MSAWNGHSTTKNLVASKDRVYIVACISNQIIGFRYALMSLFSDRSHTYCFCKHLFSNHSLISISLCVRQKCSAACVAPTTIDFAIEAQSVTKAHPNRDTASVSNTECIPKKIKYVDRKQRWLSPHYIVRVICSFQLVWCTFASTWANAKHREACKLLCTVNVFAPLLAQMCSNKVGIFDAE